MKARFQQAEGKEVREDLLLYSAYEAERTRIAADGVFPPEDLRWPVLAGATRENIPAAIQSKELPEILTDILVWYRDNHTEMSSSDAFDHQLMNDVVLHLVILKHDLDKATVLKTGKAVPVYERATVDIFWEIVEKRLRQLFPNQCHIYMRYLHWCYAQDLAEVFEPGSRPPVGKYAPPMRRNDRFGKGGGGGGRDRGGDRPPRRDRDDRPPRGDDAGNRRDREDFGNRRDRDDRPPRRDRPDRGERFERGPRRDRDDRGGNRNPNRSPEMEEAAMADVAAGIAILNGQADKNEFPLKPANGFYRRLQHQQIAHAGFYSYSSGDDPQRCVVITRDPNAAEPQ
jgi:hypothetical protein